LAAQTCALLGYSGGTLACDPVLCEFDTTGCEECGNTIIGDGEQCDGNNFGGLTCQGLGYAGGKMACDPQTCQVTGCSDHYQQDFETAPWPAELIGGGNAHWSRSPTAPHGDVYGAQSGAIGDSQTSDTSLTLTFDVPGSIAFWHRESTETCCDKLRFRIDDVEQGSWSAPTWVQETYPVAVGSHTFTWRYQKDGGYATTEDAVWIDDIQANNGYR